MNSMRGVALTHNLDPTGRRDAVHLQAWKGLAHEMLR
jgi:hypothetical protein